MRVQRVHNQSRNSNSVNRSKRSKRSRKSRQTDNTIGSNFDFMDMGEELEMIDGNREHYIPGQSEEGYSYYDSQDEGNEFEQEPEEEPVMDGSFYVEVELKKGKFTQVKLNPDEYIAVFEQHRKDILVKKIKEQRKQDAIASESDTNKRGMPQSQY